MSNEDLGGNRRPQVLLKGLAGDLKSSDVRPSPVRWLLVLVPLLAIVGIGAVLVARLLADVQLGEPRVERVAPRPTAENARPATPSVPVSPRGRSDQLIERLDRPVEVPQPSTAFDARLAVAQVASADPEAGAATFRICLVCHTAERGAANKIGPNLWGIVGRPKASRASFDYSETLKAAGGSWTYDELARFVHDPRKALPGTRMAFAGIRQTSTMASLLAHLRTLGDRPAPLPGERLAR